MAEPQVPGRNWWMLAKTVVAGLLSGAVGFGLLLVVGWSPRSASELLFPLAGLPFSLGLIGWATVLLSGNAIEGFSRHIGVSDSWSTEGGRQAMAVLIAFGAGGMIGVSLVGAPYGV